jgi:phosphoglucosamine mutase
MGIQPTPALAFLTRKMNMDIGIMITASHNPPQYNGIKIFDRNSMAYGETSQNQIEENLKHEHYAHAEWKNIGRTQHLDETQLYSDAITHSVELGRKWHVVVDPGCGATYSLAPKILKTLGCKVTAVNSQPDGFFPARSPEPNEKSLKTVARIVKNVHAGIGFAYDGDGDRVIFIDEDGKLANPDCILAAYAAYVTKRNGAGIVVTNVEASMCIEKMVEPHGAKVLRTKVGDIYLSEAIKARNAVFGGEPCGAWIHPQFHYCPDGILSSALLLKALEDEDKNLIQMVADTPTFQTLRENIVCSNDAKSEVVQKIRDNAGKIFPSYKNLSTVDGIRISFENGWILIRASGTEPLVRLTVEGESLKTAKNIMEAGIKSVEQFVGKVK